MKKAFSVFAVFMLMLTAGCEKQNNTQNSPPTAPSSFTSNIKAVYGDIEMTALLTQIAAEEFIIDFLTPEALSPLSLEYKSGSCTVMYDGLKFETDINRFPQAEIGALLTQAISDTVQGFEIQTTYSEGIWTYKGTGERGSFTITRDAETGAWLEFKADGAKLHIIFTDFNETKPSKLSQ